MTARKRWTKIIISLEAPMQPLLTNMVDLSFENLHKNYEKGLEALSLDDLRVTDISLTSGKKRIGKEDDEKEFRTKAKKGDRARNRLSQWLNNFGF